MRTLPPALDVADDGLTALVDVDVLHRDLLQRADIPERPAEKVRLKCQGKSPDQPLGHRSGRPLCG